MQKTQGLKENPAENIRSPKIAKKNIDFLEPSEIETLMGLPDDSEKGMRDRAILELLYATGIRAGEIISMEIADLNLRMGFVTCSGRKHKSQNNTRRPVWPETRWRYTWSRPVPD